MTDTHTPAAAADAVHFLAIEQGIDFEPRLTLVCTAALGAWCRKRPADDRESWDEGDPDVELVDGPCWAVEWIEEGGWEVVQCEEGEEFPQIPVTITYDEGPVIHPLAPHPLLPIPAALPTEEQVARVIINHSGPLGVHYADVAAACARAVLALLDGDAR